jgi:hypothetical protein
LICDDFSWKSTAASTEDGALRHGSKSNASPGASAHVQIQDELMSVNEVTHRQSFQNAQHAKPRRRLQASICVIPAGAKERPRINNPERRGQGTPSRMMLATARMQIAAREIVLWTTPSEPPKALQASECSELLDPMRASCLILAQHQPGKFKAPARRVRRLPLRRNSWCSHTVIGASTFFGAGVLPNTGHAT